MAGGLVYHWRHGWIPRTPTAALQKAHGSRKGADKIMAKHGIKSDLPGGHHGTPHTAPHTLKPGDHATVHGKDEFGSDIKFTGTVRGNTAVHAGRGSNRTPMRSIAVEHTSPTTGAPRTDHILVPDPTRTSAKPKADTSRARVRDLPAEGNFSGSHSETFMGEKITVRKTEWGRHETLINGQPFSAGYGSRNKDAVTALDQARRSVETMKTSSDPKFQGLYGMKTAPTANLHDARAAQLREAAAKKRAEADRIANGAGVNDRAAAMLSGRTHQRQVARDDAALRRFAEKQREASALESKAHLAAGRARAAQEKQRAADLNLKAEDVKPGDMISHGGRLRIVTKVNKTTVSVPTGYSWDDKVQLSKVTRHVPISTQSDESVRNAFHKATDPKVKAALRAELLRRGLKVEPTS